MKSFDRKTTSTSFTWPPRYAGQNNPHKHVPVTSSGMVSRVNPVVNYPLTSDQRFAAISPHPAYQRANQKGQTDQATRLLAQMVIKNPDSLFTIMMSILQSMLQQYLAAQLEATINQAMKYTEPLGIHPKDWESLLRRISQNER